MCALCWSCHKAEHAHAINIEGNPMPDGVLTVTQYEDGRILQTWESKL